MVLAGVPEAILLVLFACVVSITTRSVFGRELVVGDNNSLIMRKVPISLALVASLLVTMPSL